jgi:glycosyltransferase involved in cell wall biosynthesis
MHLLLVTDAWAPQVNGVVRTLQTLTGELRGLGHAVTVLSPERFRTAPCPSYPEIRLALTTPGAVARIVRQAGATAVHIATEGPLGVLARRHCVRHGIGFTTSLHTRFPEYVHARWRVPVGWSYGFMRRFHAAAARTMVATASVQAELEARGFRNIVRWSRGVDLELFRPRDKGLLDLPRPVSLFVGRVAIEKNIEAFLALRMPGTKVVVGDGPQRAALQARYPQVRFLGVKTGEDLARHFAAADVFVFPSRTDTFGLVLLEALACGVPVAAYPVPGPLDVLGGSDAGCLDEDLGRAVQRALAIPPQRCRSAAERFSWANSAAQFLRHLEIQPAAVSRTAAPAQPPAAPAAQRDPMG